MTFKQGFSGISLLLPYLTCTHKRSFSFTDFHWRQRSYLFSFEVLAAHAVPVWRRRAALRGAAVRRLQANGLWLWKRRYFPALGHLTGRRLYGLSRGARRQVGTRADGSGPPALLPDVSAVPGEALAVPGTLDLGRLEPWLLFHLQNWLQVKQSWQRWSHHWSLKVQSS